MNSEVPWVDLACPFLISPTIKHFRRYFESNCIVTIGSLLFSKKLSSSGAPVGRSCAYRLQPVPSCAAGLLRRRLVLVVEKPCSAVL